MSAQLVPAPCFLGQLRKPVFPKWASLELVTMVADASEGGSKETAITSKEAVMAAAVLEKAATLDRRHEVRPVMQHMSEAAERFLRHRGYDICDTWELGSQFGYVTKDDDVVSFVRLHLGEFANPELPEESGISREEFEQVVTKWLASDKAEDMVDMPVRFDVLSLKMLSSDRAFIRHHLNTFGTC